MSVPAEELTPRQIVAELDKYIIGQDSAKRSVAIAIRNRWRRQQIETDMKNEILPKNIIMIGATGVGKTEIARRLAGLVGAPFMKIEASKFTEVGYVGRDVESMIRDLMEIGFNMVRTSHMDIVRKKAEDIAEEKLLDLLLPPVTGIVEFPPENRPFPPDEADIIDDEYPTEVIGGADNLDTGERAARSREKMRKKLRAGLLEDREVQLTVESKAMPMVEIISSSGIEQMGVDFQNMFEKLIPSQSRSSKMKVSEARQVLIQQESEQLIDKDKIAREAVECVENSGIIFLDEIDKVAGRQSDHGGPDVSREGVQRDLLPIIEGSNVLTRYGIVHTDHILFIAAGAFTVSKPSDLIPELQGRFPIRVELDDLTAADFIRILTEPKNALIKQYKALLATESVKITFVKDAISELAKIAEEVKQNSQNIGARRLHTVMEKLLEEISFDAPDTTKKTLKIDLKYVKDKLSAILESEDLSKYIL